MNWQSSCKLGIRLHLRSGLVSLSTLGLCVAGLATTASAQITTTGTGQRAVTSAVSRLAQVDPVASLQDQLVNRLHATTEPQIAYLQNVTRLVEQDRLKIQLVVAVQRYAIRRNARYPFPYFERALKHEAQKRGVTLPSIRLFQSSTLPSAAVLPGTTPP